MPPRAVRVRNSQPRSGAIVVDALHQRPPEALRPACDGWTCTRSTVAQCRRSGLDEPTMRGPAGGDAVDGQHRQHVAAGVHALQQAGQHRVDVVRGHRGDEADGAAGVGDVGPAGQQLAAEDVVDGGHGTDLDIGHAHHRPAPGSDARAHDLLARRGRAVLAFRHDRPCRKSHGTGPGGPDGLRPGVPRPRRAHARGHHRRGHRAAALPALLRAVPSRPEVRGADRPRPRRRPPAEHSRAPTGGCSIPGCRADLQAGPPVYADNDLDRGHLVMRASSTWGDTEDEARQAEAETFYFTNAAPQAALVQPGPRAVAGARGLPPGERGDLRPEARRVRRARSSTRTTRPTAGSRSRCGSGRSWRSSQDGALAATGYILDQTPLVDDLDAVLAEAAAAGDGPAARGVPHVPGADRRHRRPGGGGPGPADPGGPARRAGDRRDAAAARPDVVDLGASSGSLDDVVLAG